MLSTVKALCLRICGNAKLKENNQLFTSLLNMNTEKNAYFEYLFKQSNITVNTLNYLGTQFQ